MFVCVCETLSPEQVLEAIRTLTDPHALTMPVHTPAEIHPALILVGVWVGLAAVHLYGHARATK